MLTPTLTQSQIDAINVRAWNGVNARADKATPQLAAEIERSYAQIVERIAAELAKGEAISKVVKMLTSEPLTAAELSREFNPLRERVYSLVGEGARVAASDLPKAARTTRFGFDVLNPNVSKAIAELDTKLIKNMEQNVRATVRRVIDENLQAGRGVAAIERELRAVVSLGQKQLDAISNFRGLLEAGDLEALKRELRDRRFDGTLNRLLGEGGKGLSQKQIDMMSNAYARNMANWNAETIARTAALDALKLGQRLSLIDAVDRGMYNRDELVKTWVGVMDSRERDEHVAMEGETVGFDEEFSNGQMVPGDSDYNCRCIARYGVRGEQPAARATPALWEGDAATINDFGDTTAAAEAESEGWSEGQELATIRTGAAMFFDSEIAESSIKAASNPEVASRIWAELTEDERALMTQNMIRFEESRLDWGTNGQFDAAKGIVTLNSHASGARFGTVAHEYGHALDSIWRSPTYYASKAEALAAWRADPGFFWSLSSDPLAGEYRRAIIADFDFGKSAQGYVGEMNREYFAILRDGYGSDPAMIQVEVMADLISAQRFGAAVRYQWSADEMEKMFPNTWKIVAQKLALGAIYSP